MSVIVYPRDPSRPGADRDPKTVPTVPPVQCASWCLEGTGHPGAVNIAEQACTGVEVRLDTVNGGCANGDEASVTFATLFSRAQKVPGQPVTFLIGVAAGDAEATVELNAAELRMFVEYAKTLIRLTAPQPSEPHA